MYMARALQMADTVTSTAMLLQKQRLIARPMKLKTSVRRYKGTEHLLGRRRFLDRVLHSRFTIMQ